MDTVVDIALIILLLAAAALCVYVIMTLKEVTKTIAEVRTDLNEIKTKVDPILTNVDIISNKAALLTVEVETQINNVVHMVNDLKVKVESLFSSNSSSHVHADSNGHSGPEWYRKVVGVYKGATAFWSAFKHK